MTTHVCQECGAEVDQDTETSAPLESACEHNVVHYEPTDEYAAENNL